MVVKSNLIHILGPPRRGHQEGLPDAGVFLDHDSIPLGKPFLEVIRERCERVRVALQ